MTAAVRAAASEPMTSGASALSRPALLASVRARAGLPPVRLSPPRLRTANGHDRDERRASWVELFFDLVFAGAVGQLAGALQDHPALGGLARFAMLFTPIWWLWVMFTFYADRHESEDTAHRAAFLSAMLLCAALAASAPRALSGQTTGFVIAFSCLRGLQLVLYARARHHLPATRALYGRYLVSFGGGGILWLSSLAVAGPLRYAFWAAALIADAAGALEMLAPGRWVPVNPSHLVDRFQLFVLIVLGESVARLISAAALRPWSLPLAVVLAAALLTLAALWWAWLTAADRQALDGPGSIARFTAANLPIVAGIAAASAGMHIAILAAHGGGAIGDGPRAALYGGVSVYLLASASLPSRSMTARVRAWRTATALAALGLVFMGAIVAPVFLVPALTAVLVLGLAAEARHRSPRPTADAARKPRPTSATYREFAGLV
ncbi:MAG TPA: low temperature requirement protein A [Streptosporangiaceae bacterium]|nr:low temperature requirement protein A [Streptosporangiaceae bacterium]